MARPLTASGKAFTEQFGGSPSVQCTLRFFDGTADQQPSSPVTVTQENPTDPTVWDWSATFSYVPTMLQQVEVFAVLLVGTPAPSTGPDVFCIQPG
jgi:hypothetical protein